MKKILVVAPHPDDETLGCGGTLLRHQSEGDEIHWLIATSMPKGKYPAEKIQGRADELKKVAKAYNFKSVTELGFPTTALDTISKSELVGKFSEAFQKIAPQIVLLPYPGDVHSDHRAAFDAAFACCKWFRNKSVEKILCYETISETDIAAGIKQRFRPQIYVNIDKFLSKKLEIMQIYASEMGDFPFPRSEDAIRALAKLRGAGSGFSAAEAFQLVREKY